MPFSLSSNDLLDGGIMPLAQVFNGMGHAGENLSPHLAWSGGPEGTQSYIVTCYDPDAPTGSGFWHWVVTNIPADVHELSRGSGSGGALPAGAVETNTDFGQSGYGGAAPPAGRNHRYIFSVHALSIPTIEGSEGMTAAYIGFHVFMHGLATATLTVTYPG